MIAAAYRSRMGKFGQGLNRKVTYAELVACEQRKTDLLNRGTVVSTLDFFSWTDTGFSFLVHSPLFWMHMIIYAVIRVSTTYGMLEADSSLTSALTTTGAAAAFGVVYFRGQSAQRYEGAFGHVMSCSGRVKDITMLATCCLPKDVAQKCQRLINVANILVYVSVRDGVYTIDNLLEPLATGVEPAPKPDALVHPTESRELLTTAELADVRRLVEEHGGGLAVGMVLTWIMKLVHAEQVKGTIDSFSASRMKSKLQDFRSHQGSLADHMGFPIPFTYSHFVFAMACIFLLNVSIAFGLDVDPEQEAVSITAEIVVVIVVVIANLFFLGLYLVSQAMYFPFGTEPLDFPCVSFCLDDLAWGDIAIHGAGRTENPEVVENP